MVHTFRNNAAGFTLTEMAMVVMLMGIIGSILVTSLNARMSQTSYTVTKQRMAVIKEAMIFFLRVNGRLPCSATVAYIGTADEGKENADCLSELDIANSFGIFPWSTLKLPREAVIDGWGNFFSYHISVVQKKWVVRDKFSDTDKGDFTVLQKKSDGTGTEQVTEVVLVMFSHGPNGKGAGTVKGTQNAPPTGHVHELENTNLDDTYVKRDFSDNTDLVTNPNGPFDDIVEYMTVADLVGPLIQEGSGQSANMALERQLEEIRNLLTGFILQSFSGSPCAFPATLTALGLSTATDPWGTAFTYDTPAAITVSTVADTDTIITVDSLNTALTPDIKMTKQQAVGLLAAAGRTPPACLDHSYGVISDHFSKIKHTLVAYMVNHFSSDPCDFPATLDDPSLGLPTTDPWGGNLAFTPVTISAADPGTTIIFTVTSTITFPDASTVDYTLSMTKGEAHGLMIAAGITPAGCL